MKTRNRLIAACFLLLPVLASAQQVKNVIFMIPDGTTLSDLALTRWYKSYKDTADSRLSLDPYFCGLVKTHSSNAPIGDSAPTGSAYMTGALSQTQFIGMCPPSGPDDLVKVDPRRAYSPRISFFEAARAEKNKAVGLVFTCEFPHATPAGTSAHWYKRGDYSLIGRQMVHNSIDVLIGGGVGLLDASQEGFLQTKGYEVFRNDKAGMENSESSKFWALFGERSMTNDMDRDPSAQPSLSEMTAKAIRTLSKNKSGFCLLVEGSKVDWSSHRNDPVGIVSEMLAFDKAVKVALDFAKENGQTLVVICPDHGNGGVSIGNRLSNKGYDRLSLRQIMQPLARCSKTSEYLTTMLPGLPKDSILPVVERYWGISSIHPDTIELIDKARIAYAQNLTDSKLRDALNDRITEVLNARSYIGFTTHGHTGEDVFLAIYHPGDQVLRGLVTAPEINQYICHALGLETSLDDLTAKYYRNAAELFAPDRFRVDSTAGFPLKVALRKNKKCFISVESGSNQVKSSDGRVFQTQTPAVYVDKTDTWFVSEECVSFFDEGR